MGSSSVPVRSVFLLCLLLAACAPGGNLPDLPAATSIEYCLGPGDVVRLITFGEDSLTGEFRVSDGGTIALPLVGPVPANGLSPNQLGKRVSDTLTKANLLKSPSVSVEVIAYRPIFVLGEVSKPGQYPYQPGMTVVTAAAVAGGFTYRAVDGYAAVVRTQDGVAVEGKAYRQSFVQPGDVITVLERRF
jgi:polysaccharide biosynthesis/export protein